MKTFVALTTLALSISGAAEARDPLAPLDSPKTEWTGKPIADGAPSAFGSVALRAGVTMYDARFRRVASTDAHAPAVEAAARSLRGLPAQQMLTRVHRLIRSRVVYMSDPDSMKVADLWANAGETLASGHGDDEDIAIVEMQILKAAGYPAGDLFLSVGRHPSLGKHIVLLARTPDGFEMLDHLRPAPIDAEEKSAAFRPVVTVGADGSWVHGYRTERVASR